MVIKSGIIKAVQRKGVAVAVQLQENANYCQNPGDSPESWLRQGRNVCILAAILMVVPFCGDLTEIWLAKTCSVNE